MLWFTEKTTTGTWSLVLLIWIVALVVYIAVLAVKGKLARGLAVTLEVLDISDITQSFDHDKSSSISQLIKGKSREL